MTVLNFVLCISLLCSLSTGSSIPGGVLLVTDGAKLTEIQSNVTTHLRKLSDEPNGAQLEFRRLHSVTYQTFGGPLFTILAELNENSQTANCTLTLWENFVKLDVECGDDEPRRKYGFIEPTEATTERPTINCAGCPRPI